MQDLTSDAHAEAVCRFIESADCVERQRRQVVALKCRASTRRAALGGIAMLAGAAAVIYGGLNVFGGLPLPGGLVVLMVGALAVPLSGALLLTSIAQIGAASETPPITDLETLCRTFYSVAFCAHTASLAEKQQQLLAVAECLPLPVLQSYEADGWQDLAQRWQDVQKSSSQESHFVLTSLDVEPAPDPNSPFVDLRITLRGIGFGELRLRNRAVRVGETWLLLTPEPLPEGPAAEQAGLAR